MENRSSMIKAKKSLGQNFLIDENIINKIIANVDVNSNDLIIEIGPGMGALTKRLKEKGCQLICYEVDKDLNKYLSILEDAKTKIIYKDFLLSNLSEDLKDYKYKNVFIIGNLPYYITTPIIKHIIKEKINVNSMLFMVQEEVADRFTSLPGNKEYGSITLYLKYYFNVSKLFKVSKNCFNPVPKVESAIIRMDKRTNKPELDEDKYFKMINDSFSMKRKTLKNNLKMYDFNEIEKILNKYNFNNTVRAEELPEEVFVDIVKKL